MNSKALESFLIPEEIAIEGLSEKTKGNLTLSALGLMILATIGLKISDYKKDKIYKSQVKSNNEMKKKNLETVNSKYKLSTMTEDQYKQFINKIQKESESYVKQMVNKANHDSEYIKSVRNKFIERNKNPDTGELEGYDKETLKYIKSGYFTSNWNREGYWEIIEDQDVATSGCDLHCDIAEALNTKYSELSAANIVWFSFGDGDEGCVYFGHISYENMKKKFNEAEIATEGLFDKLKGSPNKHPEGMSYSEAISKYIKIHKYYPTNDQEAELQKVLVYSIASHYENDRGASLAGIKILGHYINVEGTKYTTYYVTMENSKGITEIDFYPPNSQTPVSVAWKTFCYQVSKLK